MRVLNLRQDGTKGARGGPPVWPLGISEHFWMQFLPLAELEVTVVNDKILQECEVLQVLTGRTPCFGQE